MTPRIILSDIDGTLLTDDKRVTERTAYAVRALAAKGIPFVPVSARMPEAIYPITEAIGVKTPVISYSGGLVLTEQEEILASTVMPDGETRQILSALAATEDITVNYYAGRRWYVERMDARVQLEMDITQAHAEIQSFPALLARGELPHKLLVMCEPPVCARLSRELGAAYGALAVVRSAPHLLEIMSGGVSKAAGIEVLLRHFGLTAGEAIAFGDNYNDLEMLAMIPESVAMGNAPADVKPKASAVTATNEADGIYEYLVGRGIIEAQP